MRRRAEPKLLDLGVAKQVPKLRAIRRAGLVALVIITVASAWSWISAASSSPSKTPKASDSPARPAPGAAAIAAVEALSSSAASTTRPYALHASACQPSANVVSETASQAEVQVLCHEAVQVSTHTSTTIVVPYQVSLTWSATHWTARLS